MRDEGVQYRVRSSCRDRGIEATLTRAKNIQIFRGYETVGKSISQTKML